MRHLGQIIYRVPGEGINDPATGEDVPGAVVKVTAAQDAGGDYFAIYVEDGCGHLIGLAECDVDRVAAIDRANVLAGYMGEGSADV